MNEISEATKLVGTIIAGKYNLVRLLGEGGMGAVYLGEQKMGSAKKDVAVKVLHKSIADDPKVRARFERECGIVAQLHHPNTIQVFDFGSAEDGSLFIVMEYVQGKSVQKILETEGAMMPDRVERIFAQITGSLEEAHTSGIVHRDLKPDNVVLCERPGQHDWVEVLDFGIAKRSGEEDPREQKLTQMGMVLGTPPYMSPEQFTGKPIDARSDIYALGVMAYEMLTGVLPFNGNTPYEWATQHMTANPRPFEISVHNARIPQSMKAAIFRAMSKLPEQRFQTVREFQDAFSMRASQYGGYAQGPTTGPTSGQYGQAYSPQAPHGYGAPTPGPAYAPPYAGAPYVSGPMGSVPHGTPPRGGTEVGQAVNPYAMQPSQGQPYHSQGQPYPTGSAVAYPVPGQHGTPPQPYAAVPPAPPNDRGRGGNRGMMIGALSLLGVGALGAILAGAGVFSSNTAGGASTTPTETASPTTVPTQQPTQQATAVPTEQPVIAHTSTQLPSLTDPTPPVNTATTKPNGKPNGKPTGKPSATVPTPPPTVTAPVIPTTLPTVVPTIPPPPPTATTPPITTFTPPPPPPTVTVPTAQPTSIFNTGVEPFVCRMMRDACARGNTANCQRVTASCERAKGLR